MSTTDLLFELGTEELPAGEIDSMVTALYEGILNGLNEEGLPFAEAQYFSTPRRLAVLVRGCLLYTSPSPRDATLSRMPSSA